MWAPVALGGISNELGDRALSTVDPGPSLGSEDGCCVSHVSRNDTRLTGYATEPSASRARECGSAQGVARKEVTLADYKKAANAESPRFHRPMGFILVRNSSQLVATRAQQSSPVERASRPSRERSSTFGSPELPQNQTAPRRDDGDGGRTRRWVPARGRHQVADIPRTISGKIAELAVRRVIHGEQVGNQDALANPEALTLYSTLPDLTD